MWQIHPPLLSDELQHARMRARLFAPVLELKQHGVGDMQSGELFESGRRHDDFPTVVDILTLRSSHHHDGVAPEVFVKAFCGAGRAATTAIGQTTIVFVIEVAAEL